METEFVSAAKAGSLLGVSSTTILRWISEGRFPNVLEYPGSERTTFRIPLADIEALKRQGKDAASA